MDIARPVNRRRKRIRRAVWASVALVGVVAFGVGLSRLNDAAPNVDAATVWVDTVKRGPMRREVRGLGTLVPEEIRWVPAVTEGRVERRLVQPGAHVTPETVILVLSNQQLEQETLNAEWDWKAAQISYEDLKIKLESQQLNQEADAARIESEYSQAVLRHQADAELLKLGLVPGLTVKLEQVTAEQLANRLKIEKKRLSDQPGVHQGPACRAAVQGRAIEGGLRASQEPIGPAQGARRGGRGAAASAGRCGTAGGARDQPGAGGQSAEAEGRAQDLRDAGQGHSDRTAQLHRYPQRHHLRPGHAHRSLGAERHAHCGCVLEGELPKGAVPDLSVDGTIILENLADVVYVGRPVQGQPDSQVGLFKLEPDGQAAVRITVKLGRSSVNTIEILEGLRPGDQVILSDMSAQDGYTRIRLN